MDINKRFDLGLDKEEEKVKSKSFNFNSDDLYSNLDEFEFQNDFKIKIFGIGGAGNNMINHIATSTNIKSKWLYALNTDYQALKKISENCNKILIGRKLTKGYGSGSDPEIGRKSAEEEREVIKNVLADVEILFLLAGMGKGTGTGATPVIAEIARELGILTIGIVNLPSISVEGKKIFDKGTKGLNELQDIIDGLSTINNEKIIMNNERSLTLYESFKEADRLIADVVNVITDIISVPSVINIDFNDIKTFFSTRTSFQIIPFTFKTDSNIREEIEKTIKESLFEENIANSMKTIVSIKINPAVKRDFIQEIRSILESLTTNKLLEMNYSLDYDEEIEYAKISLLIATPRYDEMQSIEESINNVGSFIDNSVGLTEINKTEIFVSENNEILNDFEEDNEIFEKLEKEIVTEKRITKELNNDDEYYNNKYNKIFKPKRFI